MNNYKKIIQLAGRLDIEILEIKLVLLSVLGVVSYFITSTTQALNPDFGGGDVIKRLRQDHFKQISTEYRNEIVDKFLK